MPSILILDDEPEIVELTRFGFEAQGYEVRTASSAEEALRQLKEKQPNVLLIDYKLKGPATGLDFLKTVRATHPAIPAMMITGLTDQVETLREQCRQKGICAFF